MEPSGIFISYVIPGGPAALSKEVDEGDQILSGMRGTGEVHGVSFLNTRFASASLYSFSFSRFSQISSRLTSCFGSE